MWLGYSLCGHNERMDASEQGYDTPRAVIGIRQGLPESASKDLPANERRSARQLLHTIDGLFSRGLGSLILDQQVR